MDMNKCNNVALFRVHHPGIKGCLYVLALLDYLLALLALDYVTISLLHNNRCLKDEISEVNKRRTEYVLLEYALLKY
jgi:hypothetical protein